MACSKSALAAPIEMGSGPDEVPAAFSALRSEEDGLLATIPSPGCKQM